jgi:uncharacterized membrane protein
MAEAVATPRLRLISVARHPIYAMLLPVPVVCFVGALLTDITYLNSENLLWLAFSSWLILAGLVSGALAALVLLVDFIRSPGMRHGAGWLHLLLFYAALLVELLGMFIHSRDGWTAVAGAGVILSVMGAVLILAAAWLRRPAAEVVA